MWILAVKALWVIVATPRPPAGWSGLNEFTCSLFCPAQDTIYQYLVQKNMRQVQPEEAQALVASGKWVILDVRPAAKYDQAHPEGALSVPLYQVRGRQSGRAATGPLRANDGQ